MKDDDDDDNYMHVIFPVYLSGNGLCLFALLVVEPHSSYDSQCKGSFYNIRHFD